MKIDESVVKLLGIDPDKTSVSSAGGGGSTSASKSKIISTGPEGEQKCYFLKSGKGKEAEIMFQGEHESLSAIHSVVPSLCPQSFGWGSFAAEPNTFFLVTEYLDLSSEHSEAKGTAPSLAQKLANLHTTPAPVPKGFSQPQFGFPFTTYCGETPQDNNFRTSWAEFYANQRLRFILARSEKCNGKDGELRALVEQTASQVVPRLIGDNHLNNGEGVTPVVVHGDLWCGNAGRAILGGQGNAQDVVFDPSASYAHNEFELGIMKMFGGFGGNFLENYHNLCPRTEPTSEYEDRIALYELYHHLNHHALFGVGYRAGAMSIMKKLIHKYGNRNL